MPPPPSPAAGGSALSRSLHGAGYLFTSSLLQKLLSFALTQLVQRRVAAAAFGFAETRMGLYLAAALFVCREGPRLTALRAPLGLAAARGAPARARWQQLANLAWLPLPLALAVAAASAAGRGALVAGAEGVEGAGAALAVFGGVVLVEAAAEPAFILLSARLQFGARAAAEAAAALAQSLLVYALVTFTACPAALAFALGALGNAGVRLAGFWGALLLGGEGGGLEWGRCLPRWLPGGGSGSSGSGGLGALLEAQLGAAQLALLRSFFAQGLLKFVLTQADKAVLLHSSATQAQGCCSLEQQGNYAKVENLGSLVPRIVFFPVEESMRGLVSKLLPEGGEPAARAAAGAGAAAGQAAAASSALVKRRGTGRRGSVSRQPGAAAVTPTASSSSSSADGSGSNLALAATVLAAVTHLVLLLGLFIAGLGYVFAPLVVGLLRGGSSDTIAALAPLLSLYCVYVLALALNGVTEAFATAAADPQRLRTASLHYTLIAALCAGLMLASIPAHGLRAMIAVNALGMLLRSASSLSYAAALLQAEGRQPAQYLWAALPRSALTLPLLAACVAAGHVWVEASSSGGSGVGAAAQRLRQLLPPGLAEHALVRVAGAGAICCAALGGIGVLEGSRVRETWRLLRS